MLAPVGDLTGRTALVTGASGGIGAAIARALAGEGADLALGYAHDATRADELARSLDVRAVTVGADLLECDAPDRLVSEVERELGTA